MVRKLLSLLPLFLVFVLALNFSNRNNVSERYTVSPDISISGDETPVTSNRPVVDFRNSTEPLVYSDALISIYDIRTGPQTIYDLQSNGVPQQIWQDPANANYLHATFMVNLTPGWPAVDRRCYYVFSSDKGTTWTNYGAVASSSSGFCSCSGVSNGSSVMGMHTDAGGGPVRFQLFADVAPGAGTFTRLDPGINPFNSLQNIWARIMPTSSVANTRKVVTISSINTTAEDTVTSRNIALSLVSSSWAGYVRSMDIGNAEVYSFARASSGRIGLAYIANSNIISANVGIVKYMYTTDDGLNWSSPQIIWNPPPYLDGVFGALRGVSLTYIDTVPKVAFELMGLTEAGYYPSARAAIGFWSPNINGGVGFVTPFDSAWSNNGNGGATDVYTSICRPSISKSDNEQVLLLTFPVSRADTDALGSHFYDIYLSWSTTGGASWKFPPERLTNLSGPVRDNRFPSLSPTNDHFGAGTFYANIVYQNDSIPGSVTQTPPANESFAKQRYSRVTLPIPDGIKTIGSSIPNVYSLYQNYPNPFNPETKIRFELPKSENVTLKVYNAAGQLVAVIADNELQSAGLKEVTFNGNGLASGIYFYSISAGEFSMTRKMILVK